MTETQALIGRGKICAYLEIGKAAFYELVDEGMPVVKRGKRWTTHKELLDEWFRDLPDAEEKDRSSPEEPA